MTKGLIEDCKNKQLVYNKFIDITQKLLTNSLIRLISDNGSLQ